MQIVLNMKKVFSFIFAGIVDLVVVVFLALLCWIAAGSTPGFLFQNIDFLSEDLDVLLNFLKLFLLITAIPIITAIVFKRTLGSMLRCKISRRHFWKIVAASLLDFWVIVTFTIILNLWLQNIFFFEAFNLLFLLVLLYGLISAIFGGNTIGRYLLGIRLINPTGSRFFFKYKAIKYGVLIAIPYIIMYLLGIVDSYALFLNIVFIGLVSTIFSIIAMKKSIWAKFSNVTKEYASYSTVKYVVNFGFLLVFFAGSFVLIKTLNNQTQPEIKKILGFNYPYKYPDYPNEKVLKPYTDFLKTQNTSPKDYILGLFDKYDVVILQESYHGESTQWDLITEIVHDSTFIHNVGHIFTEYGSAMHQNKIETFLNTKFENDTVLEQKTAILMYYMTGGFYDFTKNLNLLNNQLPDTLKMMLHYCDVLDCDYFRMPNVHKENRLGTKRDSLMAQVTIDWYKKQVSEDKRRKCLVVTNSRHSFGYAGGIEKVKNAKGLFRFTSGNQGQYIWEQIPKKTANVMFVKLVHPRVCILPFYQPIHFGKWDKSFELNGNTPLGFDLKNTPFGNDIFDAKMTRGAINRLNYSDIYTGLVFYKPLMDLRSHTHLYNEFAVEQEAIYKGITDTLLIQEKIRNYNWQTIHSYSDISWLSEAGYINFIPILFFIFFGIFNVFLNLIYLAWKFPPLR